MRFPIPASASGYFGMLAFHLDVQQEQGPFLCFFIGFFAAPVELVASLQPAANYRGASCSCNSYGLPKLPGRHQQNKHFCKKEFFCLQESNFQRTNKRLKYCSNIRYHVLVAWKDPNHVWFVNQFLVRHITRGTGDLFQQKLPFLFLSPNPTHRTLLLLVFGVAWKQKSSWTPDF